MNGAGLFGPVNIQTTSFPDARREHEEHVARVLAGGFVETAQAAGDPPVTVLATRQHHSEATDALVVEALHQAAAAINGACGDCATCDDALDQIKAALKALGK